MGSVKSRIFGRVGTWLVPLIALLAVPTASASAALPQTPSPALQLARTIRTTPFINTTISMRDGEGSAYVPRDDSLWLLDDNKDSAYEVDPGTGQLKRIVGATAFRSAPQFGGGPPAGIDRAADLESMAYDEASDTLYAFSGACCTTSVLPTAFRLVRGQNGLFKVESYQPLPSGSDFTAAGWNGIDGKVYVAKRASLRTYDYATNSSGPIFSIPNLSGIFGMSFASPADGGDLLAVTSAERLVRVDWTTKTIKPGWSFDLRPFGVLESRAVELINDQFYVLDGKKRAAGDPLKFAVFVFNVS